MSSICRGGFVENAWRKDLCSNCFRTRDEHGEEMTSGFYSQPWAGIQQQSPSVAIHVKSPSPPSNYGLPLSGTPSNSKLSLNSRYQSPSVGSGINQLGNSSRNTGLSSVGSRYGYGHHVNTTQSPSSSGLHSISGGGSRTNLYSDRISPSRSTPVNPGINVTVNGTSNSNIKKYVQQHPPQPAVRTSIPSNNGGMSRVIGGGTNGSVSVSVGRSSSYSSQLNTIGTTNSGNRGYNNSNTNGVASLSHNNNGVTSHQHHNNNTTTQYQRRITPHHHHHQTPTHQTATTHPKNSSVPVLTQTRNHGQLYAKSPVTAIVQPIVAEVKEFRPRKGGGLPSPPNNMDGVDGEIVQVKLTNHGQSYRSGGSVSVLNRINTNTGKGILKKDGQKRKMSVSFPQEVCIVIGYGGGEERNSSDEESEEDVPSDPLDSSSVSEILEKSSTSSLEKELNRMTLKNTNFNSIKTNLLGYTPIEIGPIVGGTGGKSKPLISIGTFDGRKEPLRVMKKVGEDSVVTVNSGGNNTNSPPKNSKMPITKSVTNTTTPSILNSSFSPAIIRETENPKTSPEIRKISTASIISKVKTQNDNRVPVTVTVAAALSKGNDEKVELTQKMNQKNQQQEDPKPQFNSHPIQKVDFGIINSETPSRTTEFIITENLPIIENSEFQYSSLPHDSLEPPPPRIIQSELKLEFGSPLLYNKGSYEDDSLEAIDSGLDTKTTAQLLIRENSESDTEKSGSNSDSGNENDFGEKRNNSGLFVSVDSPKSVGKEIAKLSPDSVISSTEMSSSNSPTDSSSGGSNESIPAVVEQEDEKNNSLYPVSKLNSGNSIPPILKRAAPRPPPPPMTIPPVEEIYDDVHLQGTENKDDDEMEPEEGLYDDCATVNAGSRNGNAVKGSYDFTHQSTPFDPELGESVPLKQHEGIEFLGIRKIDSESFLKESSESNSLHSPSTPNSKGTIKKTRTNSESPKPKRRVNQFFSTIGKKAGAAFNRSPPAALDLSLSTSKGTSLKSPQNSSFTPYKRSMSSDEVSMTRTQELYATLTPTTLKLRGLTPVLNKLSKLELMKDETGDKKRNKFSISIKKFLGFGSRASIDEPAEIHEKSPPRDNHQPPPSRESPPRFDVTRPPPPPPRVHSLDTISKATTKPARPPPPRTNQIAPSFTSVFATPDEIPVPIQQVDCEESYSSGYRPPNKPKRKASMRHSNDGGDGGAYTANYLETTYNHITSLNFETLKLIASQEPAKIKRASHNTGLKLNKNPLRWSQFYITDVESLASGTGFAFFSAFWEDEPCVLLIQESLSCGLSPLEFSCIEMSASFEDVVHPQFIPWEPSDFVNTGNGVKVYISVLASCLVQKFPAYLNNLSISPSRKYYALLQAMDFWGTEEIRDLLVFHKIPNPSETVAEPSSMANKSKSSPSPNFGLVFVVSTRIKTSSNNLLSFHPSRSVFESEISKLLFSSPTSLLVENDRDILLRRMNGSTTEEIEAQLRLFFQLKLFGPQSGDLDKILRYRSEKQVTQWMDKERAYCMNDALKRSLERNSEPISPLRKSFVEFLMISDRCAKTVLDFIVDLYPDL